MELTPQGSADSSDSSALLEGKGGGSAPPLIDGSTIAFGGTLHARRRLKHTRSGLAAVFGGVFGVFGVSVFTFTVTFAVAADLPFCPTILRAFTLRVGRVPSSLLAR